MVNLVLPNISRLACQENQAVCPLSAANGIMEDIWLEILDYLSRNFELQSKWDIIASNSRFRHTNRDGLNKE